MANIDYNFQTILDNIERSHYLRSFEQNNEFKINNLSSVVNLLNFLNSNRIDYKLKIDNTYYKHIIIIFSLRSILELYIICELNNKLFDVANCFVYSSKSLFTRNYTYFSTFTKNKTLFQDV